MGGIAIFKIHIYGCLDELLVMRKKNEGRRGESNIGLATNCPMTAVQQRCSGQHQPIRHGNLRQIQGI
jgi:hypothetical protein